MQDNATCSIGRQHVAGFAILAFNIGFFLGVVASSVDFAVGVVFDFGVNAFRELIGVSVGAVLAVGVAFGNPEVHAVFSVGHGVDWVIKGIAFFQFRAAENGFWVRSVPDSFVPVADGVLGYTLHVL